MIGVFDGIGVFSGVGVFDGTGVLSGGVFAETPNTYDSDALDYFTRAEALGGSFTSPEKTAWNNYVVGLKAQSVWDDLREIYPIVSGNFSGLAAKLKHTGIAESVMVNFVSGDFVPSGPSAGLTGNGSTKSINHQTIFDGLNVQDLSFFAYCQTSISGAVMGARKGGQIIQLGQSGGDHMHFGNPVRQNFVSMSPGFMSGSSTPIGVRLFKNSALDSAAVGVPSLASDPTEWTSFATSFGEESSSRMTLTGWGLSLSDAQQEALGDLTNELMTAFGCGLY